MENDTILYYQGLIKENDDKIQYYLDSVDLKLLNDYLKNTSTTESIIALYGSLSSLWNGPKKGWQEIRNFIFKSNILFDIDKYKETTSFTSYNRILDDYNKIKVLDYKQISVDFSYLQSIYLLIIENLGLLIRLKTLNES